MKKENNINRIGFSLLFVLIAFVLALSYLLMVDHVNKQEERIVVLSKELEKIEQEREALQSRLKIQGDDAHMQQKAEKHGYRKDSQRFIIIKDLEMESYGK